MLTSLCPGWVVAAVTTSLKCSTQSLSRKRCSVITSRRICVSSCVVGVQMVVYSELVDGLHYVMRVDDDFNRTDEQTLMSSHTNFSQTVNVF